MFGIIDDTYYSSGKTYIKSRKEILVRIYVRI